jgi:hypothetical protein
MTLVRYWGPEFSLGWFKYFYWLTENRGEDLGKQASPHSGDQSNPEQTGPQSTTRHSQLSLRQGFLILFGLHLSMGL